MTIKITITHDEPDNKISLHIGCLRKRPEFDVPQMEDVKLLPPGGSLSVYVHGGSTVEIWEKSKP